MPFRPIGIRSLVRQFQQHVAVAWPGCWTKAEEILPAKFVEVASQLYGPRVVAGDPGAIQFDDGRSIMFGVDLKRIAPLRRSADDDGTLRFSPTLRPLLLQAPRHGRLPNSVLSDGRTRLGGRTVGDDADLAAPLKYGVLDLRQPIQAMLEPGRFKDVLQIDPFGFGSLDDKPPLFDDHQRQAIEPPTIEFHAALESWARDVAQSLRGETLAFDGKTLRGSFDEASNRSALHSVSAWACGLKMCLALKSVEDKSNEIPAVQQLIDVLDLKGAVVAADAMHCQVETAGKVLAKEADYVLMGSSASSVS